MIFFFFAITNFSLFWTFFLVPCNFQKAGVDCSYVLTKHCVNILNKCYKKISCFSSTFWEWEWSVQIAIDDCSTKALQTSASFIFIEKLQFLPPDCSGKKIQDIRSTWWTFRVSHSPYIMCVPYFLHFIQFMLHNWHEAKSQHFHMVSNAIIVNARINKIFKKVNPPSSFCSSKLRPPSLYSLIGRWRTIPKTSLTRECRRTLASKIAAHHIQ